MIDETETEGIRELLLHESGRTMRIHTAMEVERGPERRSGRPIQQRLKCMGRFGIILTLNSTS